MLHGHGIDGDVQGGVQPLHHAMAMGSMTRLRCYNDSILPNGFNKRSRIFEDRCAPATNAAKALTVPAIPTAVRHKEQTVVVKIGISFMAIHDPGNN